MSNKKKKWPRRLAFALSGAGLALLLLPIVVIAGYGLTYRDRAFPGVMVADSPISGMRREAIEKLVKEKVANYQSQWPQTMSYDQYVWTVPYPRSEINFMIEQTTVGAMQLGRQGNPVERVVSWYQLLNSPKNLPVDVTIDPKWQSDLVASIAATINKEMAPPRLIWDEKKENLWVDKGVSGRALLSEAFSQAITNSTQELKSWDISPYIQEMPVTVSDEEAEKTKQRGKLFLDLDLTIKAGTEAGQKTFPLEGKELIDWIQFGGGFKTEEMNAYLNGLKEEVDHPPVNANLMFDKEIGKLTEVSPPLEGWDLEVTGSQKAIQKVLRVMEETQVSGEVDLIINYTKPEIGLEQVNDLGIKELLGTGESTYFHSILTRVHNVGLAASRINGTLVKPGEVFSFNEAVGEISGATGYKQAYIIKDGKTELGDGGGVCQDSTTVFRAALDAGLPIIERRAHAYRVGYYEQDTKAGIDATVFSPSTDFKFLNDTPAHILVQVTNDAPNRHLKVELYGTSDGRTSEILNHAVWGVTPPLPDVYVDDPSLKAGEVKQIDWKAAGAKAKFDYRVVRNGEILIEKTFNSNYKPWASVYLLGQ